MRRLFVLLVLTSVALLAAEAGVGGGVRASTAAATRTRQACRVPNVKGQTVGAAKRALEHHHCRVGAIHRALSRTVAKGRVISQRPRPGARGPMGSRVSLVVSKGAPLTSAGSVVARIAVSPGQSAPLGLLTLPGAVWVADHRGDSIYRIDPASNKIVVHVVVAQGGEQPARMVYGNGTIFAVNYSGNTISLIDPIHNTLTSTIHAPLENCCGPAYGAGSLWLLEFSGASADHLVRLDPSGQILMTMPVSNGDGLTFGAGSVWGSSGGQVFRLDPTTGKIVAHIPTGAVPVTFGAGSVWGLSADGRTLIRIDPAANSVSATIRLPAAGSSLTATDSAVWVAEGPPDSPGSHLWKIDSATNRVVGQVKLGGFPSALDDVAVDGNGDVWVSEFDTDTVLRIHPTG